DPLAIYGTKLLSDLGATVTRVEDPSDAPLDERVHAWCNTGKRSAVLTLDAATVQRLAANHDVVVASGAASRIDTLDLVGLQERTPSLIVATVTPFGLNGPFRDWYADDLVAWAMG